MDQMPSSPPALNAAHIAGIAAQHDLRAIEMLFDRYGSERARIITEPPRDQILDPQIAAFWTYYQDMRDRRGGAPPLWSDFSLADARDLVGSLHVLARDEETGDMRYLIFGTDVAARYGRDLTGQLVANQAASLAVVFHGLFQAAATNDHCYYSTHYPPEDGPVRDCQRLIVPFHGNNDRFYRLVVAHKPARTPRSQVGGTL